jgi:hypothetical protein
MRLTLFVALIIMPVLGCAAEQQNQHGYQIKTTPEALVYVALQNTAEVNVHQMGGAVGNEIYVSPDGAIEAVYDETGNLVVDCLNKGTANFAHPWLNPVSHFEVDTMPWLKWGSCEVARSTLEDRAKAWVADFEVGFRQALSDRAALRTFTKVEQRDLEKSDSISMLIDALYTSEAVFSEIVDAGKNPTDEDIATMMHDLVEALKKKIGETDAN